MGRDLSLGLHQHTASGRGMTTWCVVAAHRVCQLTSGTGLAWVNSLLQATSGHAWGMAEGKKLSPQPTWVREHQKCIWCAAPAVIHQHSARFSGYWNSPGMTPHCFSLSWSSRCLLCACEYLQTGFCFHSHPFKRWEKSLEKQHITFNERHFTLFDWSCFSYSC